MWSTAVKFRHLEIKQCYFPTLVVFFHYLEFKTQWSSLSNSLYRPQLISDHPIWQIVSSTSSFYSHPIPIFDWSTQPLMQGQFGTLKIWHLMWPFLTTQVEWKVIESMNKSFARYAELRGRLALSRPWPVSPSPPFDILSHIVAPRRVTIIGQSAPQACHPTRCAAQD